MQALDPKIIRYRCHRGMLELDLILIPFYDQHFAALTDDMRQKFIEFLQLPDPELYQYLVVDQAPQQKEFVNLVELIKQNN